MPVFGEGKIAALLNIAFSALACALGIAAAYSFAGGGGDWRHLAVAVIALLFGGWLWYAGISMYRFHRDKTWRWWKAFCTNCMALREDCPHGAMLRK